MNKVIWFLLLFALIQCQEDDDATRDVWIGQWIGSATSIDFGATTVQDGIAIEFRKGKRHELICTGAISTDVTLQLRSGGIATYASPVGDYSIEFRLTGEVVTESLNF